MNKKIFVVLLVGLFLLASFVTTGVRVKEKNAVKEIENNNEFDYDEAYPVMRLSTKDVERMEQEYNNYELAYIDPNLSEEIQSFETYSILDLLEYDPVTRSQGGCGNCWAWPSTAVLAIALNVQEGIKDRLSVQFINTCGERYTYGQNLIECCGGGTIGMFANFYKNTNFAIPWSNTMAHWHDGGYFNCRTDCKEIGKTPNYPIYSIKAKTITTRNVPEEEAIDNIKNILHQQRGVYFSVFYPDLPNLDSFRDMWRNDEEYEPYDLDYYCGNEWTDDAVGHAMLIVGYQDVEGTENDYWIVLNSWGTTENRPNGLLTWDMHMDYGCKYSNYYAFGANTLEVDFQPDPEAPNPPTINGPTEIELNKEYTYTFSAVDPQDDPVYIYVQWTVGSIGSGWLGPYESGEEVQVSHTWTKEKNFVLRAKARDENKNTSIYTSFEITMPRNRARNTPLQDFLANYLNAFPLIQKLIQRLLRY